MSQIFHEEGGWFRHVIQAGPCKVSNQDGGEGKICRGPVGFEEKTPRKAKKPLQGHFAKAKPLAFRY